MENGVVVFSPSSRFTRRSLSGVAALLDRPASEGEAPAEDPYRVAGSDFPLGVRGYDRAAVDAYLDDLQIRVDDLRAQSSPPDAVRRAIDTVGEETSGILRHAHETADEITARAREEAERRTTEAEASAASILRAAEAAASQLNEEARRRVQAAEQSAAAIVAAAEVQASRLDEDVDRIWSERMVLIDDVERVSRTLLKVSKEASRRFPPEESEPEKQALLPVPQAESRSDQDKAPAGEAVDTAG